MFRLHHGPFIDLAKRMRAKPNEVEELVMDRKNIKEIQPEELEPFMNLQYLYLNHNQLTVLSGLNHLVRLKVLDARDNNISDVRLTEQHFLKELYLARNKLRNLDEFLPKVAHLRELRVLDLRENSVALENDYRKVVVRTFPELVNLDGHPVTARERQRQQKGEAVSTASRRKRPRSILQCLQERPMSAADVTVRKKAEMVRKQRKLEEELEQERLTATARKRKEEFEAASRQLGVPMPEEMDFLGQSIRRAEALKPKVVEAPRPHTRMYLKRPVYVNHKQLTDEEERVDKLNPRLPGLFAVRVEYEMRYPK